MEQGLLMIKKKQIYFNEEMERDFESIRQEFKQKFNITPSNTEILNLLMNGYRNNKSEIKRKPKSWEFTL